MEIKKKGKEPDKGMGTSIIEVCNEGIITTREEIMNTI